MNERKARYIDMDGEYLDDMDSAEMPALETELTII